MRVARRRQLLTVFAVAAALTLAAPFISRVTLPVVDTVEILSEEIYQILDNTKRIPAAVAVPYIARARGSQFVKRLPLEGSVRDRVLARLDSSGFVHEIVPFVLAVKNMYVAADEKRTENFDTYLRRNFVPGDNLPGFEHSMFSWTPDTSGDVKSDDAGFGFDRDLASELIEFYDALYLEGRDPTAGLDERLACGPAEIEGRLADTATRSGPALRSLLRRIRDGMEPHSELADALNDVLNDDEAFETIGITVVHFIELMVCKQYRMFASRVTRQDQLEHWLSGELEREQGGRIWSYLHAAQDTRRYGALIVVDGLQGHLIEALARGDSKHPFVQRILEERRSGEQRMNSGPPLAHDLRQQTVFLDRLSSEGFTHPAYLPFFRDLFSDAGADDTLHPWAVAVSGISTTPTISVRNLPVVMTGAPVAGVGATGVPNFHFVDRNYERNGVRQGRAFYFFGNDALQLTKLTADAGMQSLFERLPGRSSYSCSAQYDEWAQDGVDPFFNLAFGEVARDFGEILCFRELERRAENEIRLRQYRNDLLALRDRLGTKVPFYDWYRAWGVRAARTRAKQLIRRIAELEVQTLPELLVYYNPWPDHFAHLKGPFSDEILSPSGELARLDYWLGRLSMLYDRAGVNDRTLFGMAGDHGLSPVFQLESPEARVLEPLKQRGIPVEIIKISSDEGEGPKLTHALEPPSMRGYDVVIASTAGGNLMLDLFVNQTDRWHEQPLESDVRVWRPAAWQTQENAQHASIDLIEELLAGLGDTLDYLAVRAAPASIAQSEVRILGPGGGGLLKRQGVHIYYAIDGTDLLQTGTMSPYDSWTESDQRQHRKLHKRCVVDAKVEDPASWCSERDWRRLAAYTPRPDSVVQIAHLYDLDRAGTINLFPAQGVAYNSIVPGRHAGESFHEKDAFAGVWGAPIQRGRIQGRIPAALGGSIPTAIYEHLTGQPITPGLLGWGYPSLWNELYPDTGVRLTNPDPVH